MAIKTINTIAGFKRFLSEAKEKNVLVRVDYVNNQTGETIRSTAPAPISKLQTNSFALLIDGKHNWTDFEKAGAWVFNLADRKATKVINNKSFTLTFL